MKLIDVSVINITPSHNTLRDVFKMIEIAGRTCYKSEANITDDSAQKFTERMIASKHTSMLEHGTLYLDVPLGNLGDDREYMWKSSIIQIFKKNKYSRVNKYKQEHNIDDNITINVDHYAITTNYRVFIEQIDWDGLGPMRHDKLHSWELGLDKEYVLSFMCEPNEHHEKRYSFRVVTDRGVTHEAVRHRVMSFGQESTRYCNYLKEKFGMSVTFMQPKWIKSEDQNEFEEDLKYIESIYFKWLNKGYKPEQARYFLINGTKTEIVITGFMSDWQHFIDLRSTGTTGKPHPDIKIIGDEIKNMLNL